MKNTFITITVSTIFLISACGPSPKQAAKYNSAITVLEKRVIKALDSLDRSYKTFDTIVIYTTILHTEEIVKKNKQILTKKIKVLGKDSSLYNIENELFDTMMKLLKEEYFRMYKLQCLPSEKYGNKEEKLYLKTRNKKDEIMHTVFEKFKKVQVKFADRYHIKLKNKESDLDF